ncbi:MAG: TolC family protein [Candidatus Omnitrophica bacterium]|nr:TolC family protein [Candidatus Omnitrophota bacterium]
MKKNKLFLIFVLSFIFIPNTYSLSEYVISYDSLVKDIRQSEGKEINLSFQLISELALGNSLDVQIARYDAYIKQTELKKAESIFDAFLDLEANYTYDKKDTVSDLVGTNKKNVTYSAGITKKLFTGTTLSLDAESIKEKTNSSSITLNPNYESLAEVSISQELGKNFFGLADRADIKITKLDIENSDFSSLDKIEQSLFAAQEAYLNFLRIDKEFTIRGDMLAKAKELFQIYKKKFSLGIAEKPELLAIKALVKRRISELEVASLERLKAKNNLFFLLNISKINKEIKAVDDLFIQTEKAGLYQALREAINYRRDYKQIKNELKKNNIQVIVKKNALWPEIDLEASFARNNIGGSYSDSINNFTDESHNQISVGVSVKLPLENNKAQAELKAVELQGKKNLILFKKIERLILKDINNKVSNVNSYFSQIKTNQEIVEIQQEKLTLEKKRLEAGLSSADIIIDYHQDLLKSRLSLVDSLFKYRVSIIDLELVKNSLLDKYWNESL